LYVTPEEARAVIPRIPTLYDEPFADSSQIPTFLVSQLARRHVTVSLSGDGGDELFGGYNRYFWGRRIWRDIGWLPAGIRRAAGRGITAISPAGWDRVYRGTKVDTILGTRYQTVGERIHRLVKTLAVADPEEMYRTLVSMWIDPTALAGGVREPSTILSDRQQWADLDDFTERMMFLDLVTYLPDDILVKVDRASMGVSLEARAPFLDHRVVEFAWRIPLSLKIKGGKGKWPLRDVLDQYVPRDLIERPKVGFGAPIGAWLRGPLREWGEDLLDESRLRREGMIDPTPVRAKWEQLLSGSGDWQHPLWTVLMFQAWFAEQQSGSL
jgi:asparagine synthase (glutamine-hydrolysing)